MGNRGRKAARYSPSSGHRLAAIDLDLLVEHHERMEADESASRADQHSTGVSAVERAKVRAIRLRPGQQDQVGLQVEVDPTAGCTGIGRSLSDSVLQVFKVECQSRSLLHTFRGQTCQLLQRTGLAPASARICDWLARSAQSARVAPLAFILAPRATPAPNAAPGCAVLVQEHPIELVERRRFVE